jgi:hypothetical protein
MLDSKIFMLVRTAAQVCKGEGRGSHQFLVWGERSHGEMRPKPDVHTRPGKPWKLKKSPDPISQLFGSHVILTRDGFSFRAVASHLFSEPTKPMVEGGRNPFFRPTHF